MPDDDLAQTRAYMLHWNAPDALNLVIEEPDGDGGGFCGAVGFRCDDGRVELGYMLLPRVWGRGYAREAVFAARDAWAADYAGVRSATTNKHGDGVIWADTHHENEASRRVLVRCGFTKIRDAEDEYGAYEEWSYHLPNSIRTSEAQAETKQAAEN